MNPFGIRVARGYSRRSWHNVIACLIVMALSSIAQGADSSKEKETKSFDPFLQPVHYTVTYKRVTDRSGKVKYADGRVQQKYFYVTTLEIYDVAMSRSPKNRPDEFVLRFKEVARVLAGIINPGPRLPGPPLESIEFRCILDNNGNLTEVVAMDGNKKAKYSSRRYVPKQIFDLLFNTKLKKGSAWASENASGNVYPVQIKRSLELGLVKWFQPEMNLYIRGFYKKTEVVNALGTKSIDEDLDLIIQPKELDRIREEYRMKTGK